MDFIGRYKKSLYEQYLLGASALETPFRVAAANTGHPIPLNCNYR
jgi:hypothetical protein